MECFSCRLIVPTQPQGTMRLCRVRDRDKIQGMKCYTPITLTPREPPALASYLRGQRDALVTWQGKRVAGVELVTSGSATYDRRRVASVVYTVWDRESSDHCHGIIFRANLVDLHSWRW